VKFSIITVCRNAAATIPDTLAAVREQQYGDVEHLVIDGGSTDATLDILRSPENAEVRWISEADQGIYDAMNKGLALASGEVIGFLNADDLYADNQVLGRVAEVFADAAVDGVYGDLVYVDREHPEKVARYWRSCSYHPGLFQRGWAPPHPTFFVRREVYERLGGFNLKYGLAADAELMLRFIVKHRITTRYLNNLMVRMRLGGVTNQSFQNILEQNREIIEAFRDNDLAVTLPVFLVGKLAARAWQYMAGRVCHVS
jgi:glycosyltransferase involved in cell wall biosynthesis